MPWAVARGNHRAAQILAPFHMTEGHAMDMTETQTPRRDVRGSVLCIEDDPVSRELVEALLADPQWACVTAASRSRIVPN
eukprot:gene39920-biopygen26752